MYNNNVPLVDVLCWRQVRKLKKKLHMGITSLLMMHKQVCFFKTSMTILNVQQ